MTIRTLAAVGLLFAALLYWQGYRFADPPSPTPAQQSTSLVRDTATRLWAGADEEEEFLRLTADIRTGSANVPVTDTLPDSAPRIGSEAGAEKAEADLQSLSPVQLWQRWLRLLNRADLQQIPIVGALLAERLRQHPDPEVYRGIERLLAQRTISTENKAMLLDLLGEIATPDSLKQLVQVAVKGQDTPLYIPALQVISRIGDNRWDGRFHEELSPLLEKVWFDATIDDPVFLSAIAKAMAGVGTVEGVELLLSTVAGENKSNDTVDVNRLKQAAAFEAVPKIRNPAAVDALSARLRSSSGTTGLTGSDAADSLVFTPASADQSVTMITGTGNAPVEKNSDSDLNESDLIFNIDGSVMAAAGNALAEIGTPQATQAILDWAQQATDEGARYLENWLPKISDAGSLTLLTASQSTVDFQSQAVADVYNGVVSGLVLTGATDTASQTAQ